MQCARGYVRARMLLMAESRAPLTTFMLKLKHYNLFSSVTVAGFIRHTLTKVDGSICENAVYLIVVCFIHSFIHSLFFFVVAIFVSGTFKFRSISIAYHLLAYCFHVPFFSVHFNENLLLLNSFCARTSAYISYVCNMRFADTLC